MTTTGVTSTGFVAKTQADLVADINTALLANVDPGLDLAPDQPAGQMVVIFAEKLAELWELGATAYNGFNPGAADGELLVSLAALTGTLPDAATPSQVTCLMTLAMSTTVLAGSVANVSGQPTNTWTLVGPPDLAGNPIPGPVVSTTAGTYPGVFQATVTGPTVANAGTLTVITAPVTGWSAVTNPTDAVLGSVGTDPTITGNPTPLRQKREAELAAPGACTTPAIQAAVDEVPGVVSCQVYENVTLLTDANGLPGKCFEAVVWDGVTPQAADNAIAQAIWDNKPSGIFSFGNLGFHAGAAVDIFGVSHIINFTRVTQTDLYIDVTTTPSGLSTPQAAAVRAAIVAYCNSVLMPGAEVVQLAIRAAGIVSGVTIDVPTCEVDTVFPPVNTGNLTATIRQIFIADTSRIRVNGV